MLLPAEKIVYPRVHHPGAASKARLGAVSFVHRFGSALLVRIEADERNDSWPTVLARHFWPKQTFENGWIELLPQLGPLAQPEPDFQFDQTVCW